MEGAGTSVLAPLPAAEGSGHHRSDCCGDGWTGHSPGEMQNLTGNAGSVLPRCLDSGSEPDADRKNPYGDATSYQQPLAADCIDRTISPLPPAPTSPSTKQTDSSAVSMEPSSSSTLSQARQKVEGPSSLTPGLQLQSSSTGQAPPA